MWNIINNFSYVYICTHKHTQFMTFIYNFYINVINIINKKNNKVIKIVLPF